MRTLVRTLHRSIFAPSRLSAPTPALATLVLLFGVLSAPASLAEDAPRAEEQAVPGGPAEEPKIEGEVVPGVQAFVGDSDAHSAKFLEYRDVPSGFVMERFLFSWETGKRSYFELDARDISQRDQRIGAEFGRTDLWRGTIRWSENPRRWTDRAFQLYADRGDRFFRLDDALQAAVQAAPASADVAPADGFWDAGTKGALIKSAIQQSAHDVDVGHQRRRGGVGFELTPCPHWVFSIDADRDRRNGTFPQTLGMTFSLAPAEVAAPYNLTTDWATGRAEYVTKGFNVGAQITASRFEVADKALVWDNQLILSDTAVNANSASPGRMRMLLGTDNQSVRIGVSGGANLPGLTRVDASVARTETTQDDPFQPMTINSLLAPAPLPDSRFDGEHVTTVAQVRVSSRPTRAIHWRAWFRSFDLENNSPSLEFADYVQTDTSFTLCANANACGATTNRLARRSLPYGFERSSLGGSFAYTPVKWFTGSIGYEREKAEREFSAVEDSDEDIWKLTADLELPAALSVRATLKKQERRADAYHAHYFEESFPIGEAVIAPVNEGSRRFYWTDRDRDAYALLVDWTPDEKLSLYAEGSYTNDDYEDPETGRPIGDSFQSREDRNFDGTNETYTILLAGRTEDRSTSYSVGAAFSPSGRVQLHGDYTWEEWKYGLESRYRNVTGGVGTDNPLDNWGSDTVDEYQTATLGFEVDLTAKKDWRLQGDASRSRGTGEIETHFVPGGAASGDTSLTEFPQLATRLTIATLSLTHHILPNLEYTLGYWYESWKEDNFASDFNRPYMGDPPNDPSSDRSVFLGLDFKDYTNHIARFLLRYRF